MFYTNSFFLLNKLNVVEFDLIENRNVNQNTDSLCAIIVTYKVNAYWCHVFRIKYILYIYSLYSIMYSETL